MSYSTSLTKAQLQELRDNALNPGGMVCVNHPAFQIYIAG